MSDILVIKRDGRLEEFDIEKVSDSIMEAAMTVGGENFDLADEIAEEVLDLLESNGATKVTAADLQAIVEKTLIEDGHAATARQYILVGADRSRIREMNTALMKSFEEITFTSPEESETKRENANIDSSTAMGTMLKYGSEGAKNFNLIHLISQDIAEAHRNGDIHIHDLDFYSLTETCCQIPLSRLFEHGFNTGHGFLRKPGNIRTAGALAAIAVQSNQNDQHGGQSIPLFDYYLAPYVALTYVKELAEITKVKFDLTEEQYLELKDILKEYWEKAENHLVMSPESVRIIKDMVTDFLDEKGVDFSERRIERLLQDTYDKTYSETFQSMEAFIHNLNTMHCLPASEKIWVLDIETNKIRSITMEELDDTFKPNKYKVVSLNKETGKAEWKFVTASKKMDNNRSIVKITDNQGRTVRVTDNHRIMTVDKDNLTITEVEASDVEYVISPRGINMPAAKYDLCVSDYGKPRSDNPFKNDHILLNERFAEFIGYYMGDGCMLGETSTCCISACGKVSFEYMENLMEEVFGCRLKTSYTYFNHSKNGKTEKDIRIQLGMPLARMIKDKFGRIGKEKKIPTELMCASNSVKRAFLKAYFNMDGRQDKQYSELSTVNKELQAQIALMIYSLGYSTHYSTRNCNNGFDKSRPKCDMHFLSIGAKDSERLGLKDKVNTAFEIPKYDLSFIYDKFKAECDEVISKRNSNNIRYNELEELLDCYECNEAKKFTNIFVNKIESKEYLNSGNEYVYDISVEDNESFLTYECIFVHNSRAGAQVPFSSVNYGTDTSVEGRMIIETILKTTYDGLGNGETAIFPVQIFKLKDGVNFKPGDPNFDLFKLSCKVSAKRLYPNWVNLDAPYNAELYVPGNIETEMATMGCVESEELIRYSIGEDDFIEPFRVAYNKVLDYVGKEEHINNSYYIDTENYDIKVYDSFNKGYVKVKKFIKNTNVSNMRTVKFSNGFTLTATGDHPLPVENKGRIYVDNLVKGDRLKVADWSYNSDKNIHTDYFGSNMDTCWLLGILMCDSSYSSQITASLGMDELDVVNNMERIVTDLGYRLDVKEQHRGSKGDYIDASIREINGLKYAEEELKSLFGGYNKKDRFITSKLINTKRCYRLALLAGMMDADGHVTISKCRDGITPRSARFSLGSTNKALAMTELALIRGLGFKAKLMYNNYSSKHKKVRYLIEFEISEEVLDLMHCTKKILVARETEWCKFSDIDEISVVKVIDGCPENAISDVSYDLETESDRLDISFIHSHNCRTRVGKNVYDPSKSVLPGRGNLSFTSINLPRLGIEAKGDINKFYKLLDNRLELVHRQLLERFEIQCLKHPINYPFLMGQGCWLGSDRLGPNDDIRSVLRHGSLTVGFIGLAETLVALTGKHHGESEESQKLGLEIIQHMRDYTDKWSEEEKMNYTVIGTPAEGLSGRFIRIDKERYGIIKGITDKEYYTNSSHVPVSFPITAFNKVNIEAPYHAIENGGHILYIEVDGDPSKNLKGFMKLINYMHDKNAGYMAINHPLDRDPICGYVGIIDDVCPRCGRRDGEAMTVEMWQKLKGYANAGNSDTLGVSGNMYEEADRITNPID